MVKFILSISLFLFFIDRNVKLIKAPLHYLHKPGHMKMMMELLTAIDFFLMISASGRAIHTSSFIITRKTNGLLNTMAELGGMLIKKTNWLRKIC